ncbi:MAG TPA: PQQ-dependent sugar dehydrogenase, partial [Planctomycetota bacterium]|nr:PQQ-dependent sugar dehydrogenase [Planctomycetota bacterium]
MIYRLLVLLVAFLASGWAASLPITTTEVVSGGLSLPVGVTHIPGDANRLFVIEQHTGQVRIVTLATGALSATPFLTEPGVTQGGEQGLLGIAFHPDFATNGYVYINCTKPGAAAGDTSGSGGGHTEIVRYTANTPYATATSVNTSSRVVVVAFNQPEENHNGGWVGFGADDYLYIATGDGGGGGDVHGTNGNGQSLTTLLGKILRLNVATQPYTTPSGNMSGAAVRSEIFAFGVRNPWRCSIDRANGNLWIGDVGQDAHEEVSFGPAGTGGRNYGWRRYEGFSDYNTGTTLAPGSTYTPPVVDYPHSVGQAVVGGYVYRG